LSAIDTEYQADDPLPPGGITEVSLVAKDIQERFRVGHDADGTHNDPLVPHAWAVLTEAAGVYTIAASEGVDTGSSAKQAQGHYRIVVSNAMRSATQWQVVAWPIYKAGGTGDFPLYCYEARDGGAYNKGAVNHTTVDIKIVKEDGSTRDCGFHFAVYGLRSY
jgi:hypothetical protein